MWVLKGEAVSSTKGSVAKLANPKAVMERQALLSARINEMYIMLRNSRLGPRFAEWFRSNINGLIEWYGKRHAQPATSGMGEEDVLTQTTGTSGEGRPDKPIEWPPNRGFASSTQQTLHPGTLIDRYGRDTGSFVSPQGTPFLLVLSHPDLT